VSHWGDWLRQIKVPRKRPAARFKANDDDRPERPNFGARNSDRPYPGTDRIAPRRVVC
jgi:hypothetical protein